MRRAVAGAAAALLAGAVLAPRAEAAQKTHRFEIAPKAYAEALIDLAVQANVSVLGTSVCGASTARGLSGRFTLAEALAKLLADAPCLGRVVDASTVRILPRPPGRLAATRPAAPGVAELLVVSPRRPERLDDLPAGVSAIGGEQLTDTFAVDARDTQGQLVGVVMTNLGPGRDKMLMRGLSDGAFTGRASSTVATYLDDTPLNFNAPDPDLRLVDVARVEALRGPQGALYGSGAISGVYRIVTNKPELDRASGSLSLIGASMVGGSPSRAAEGVLNAPLASGRAGVRIVGWYDLQGGYLDDIELGLSNLDRTSRVGGRLALRAHPLDGWDVDLVAGAQRLNTKDAQYTSLGGDRRANRVREAHRDEIAVASLTVRGDLGFADLRASAAYVNHTFDSLYDATAVAPLFATNGVGVAVYSESARLSRVVEDIVLTSNSAGRVSWLAGVYAQQSISRTPSELRLTGYAGPLGAVYQEQRREKLTEGAVYGETSWRLDDRWTLALGGRLYLSRADASGHVTVAGVQTPAAGSVETTGFSPKVSLQRRIGETVLVYGLYSQGARPGGVNLPASSGLSAGGAAFSSDRLQNVEAGAKARLADGRLVLRGAAFYDLWSNIQSDQFGPAGLGYVANVGNARIWGFEAEAAADLGGGLTVEANALYSHSRLFHPNPAFGGDLGAALPGAPQVSAGVLAQYQRPLSRTVTLRLIGRAAYESPMRVSFDPRLTPQTDPIFDVRLSAELAHSGWSAGLFLDNPGNLSGNTFAFGNPFSLGQIIQATPQRPLTVGLRLSARYN